MDETVLLSEKFQNRVGWQKVIDDQLIEWGKDPSQFEDDGIEVPSGESIRRAYDVARRMHDAGVPPPLRVVPDGDGGITFERQDGPVFQTIEIADDGSVEGIVFENSRLVSRQPVSL